MIDRFERFSFAIFEISRHWHKIAADELAQYDLKGPYATYLTTMYRHTDGITAARLCELCGKDKSDVSRAMALMESRGLVKREGVKQNLYRARLKLTDTGKTAAEHVCQRAALVVEQAGKELSPETRETFYETLDLIASNLRRISKDGLPQQDHNKEEIPK